MFTWPRMINQISRDSQRFNLHQVCVQAALSVAIIVSTLKFIFQELNWLVETLRLWLR
jgi:hypothetical protein